MFRFSSKINISDEKKQHIKKCLPPNWDTDIKEVHLNNDFEIFFRVNAKTVDEIKKWISEYQLLTNTAYSVETTYKCAGQRVIFKRSYHCQHKTRHKHTYDPVYRRSIRNTNCPSAFSVAIRKFKKRYQGKDKSRAPDPNKPCEIRLKLSHNHSVTNSMALKFKKVLPEVKAELLKLFSQGHTASTALQAVKMNIKLNFENSPEICSDRGRCPDYSYCHYMFQKCASSVEFNNEFLLEKLNRYDRSQGGNCAKMTIGDSGVNICLCPPLVQRAHEFEESSANIVFIDSFSIFDKGTQLFLLVTQSETGALPLGLVISSCSSSLDIKSSLSMLKDMLGPKIFYNNPEGPQIFLSDEFVLDNKIISDLFPKSKNLLSSFHTLQNIYKYLQSSKNAIATIDKPVLFKDFYNLVHSTNEEDFLSQYETAKQNSLKYKHYSKHLNAYFDRRHLWANCFRPSCPEIIFRTIRDKVFQSLKSFNLVQIVDFILNYFFRYFEKQLTDVALVKSIQNLYYTKDELPPEEIQGKIQILSKNIRLVPSNEINDLFYLVNSELLTCTCFDGSTNNLCQHIKWICMLVYMEDLSKHAKTLEIRKKCYHIATGNDLLIETTDTPQQSPVAMDINQDNEIYEETYVAMETTDIVDINDYLIIKKNDSVTECRDSLKKITDKIEELIENEPQEMLSTLRVIYSRFQAVETINDVSTVFSIPTLQPRPKKGPNIDNKPKMNRVKKNKNVV